MEEVKKLKDSIRYRSEHKKIIEEFKHAIKNYFWKEYDVPVSVLTGVTWFAIEKNISIVRNMDSDKAEHMWKFEFTIDVLYKFCKTFECKFEHTACDGHRYVFTFDDVDMSNAFILG